LPPQQRPSRLARARGAGDSMHNHCDSHAQAAIAMPRLAYNLVASRLASHALVNPARIACPPTMARLLLTDLATRPIPLAGENRPRRVAGRDFRLPAAQAAEVPSRG